MSKKVADHVFKTDPEPFRAVWRGQKRAELRDETDRLPKRVRVGDFVHLLEHDRATNHYSGDRVRVRVTHVQGGYVLGDNCVMFSFRLIKRFRNGKPYREQEAQD